MWIPTVKDLSFRWKNLKERFDHQKEVVLPATRDEWALRFQDFKKVSDYNSAMFKIVSQLKFCVMNITYEEILEKTYSTFHASHIKLQQQYRLHGFKTYSELISSLLVVAKNNELLIKNQQSCPTSSEVFSEANVASFKIYRWGYNRHRGLGLGRGRGRGRSRSGYYNPSQNNMIHKKHHVERYDKRCSWKFSLES